MKRGVTRRSAELNKAQRAFVLASCLLMIMGFWRLEGTNLIAYLIVLASSVLPTFLWLRAGAVGIPIMPSMAFMHYIYYALPIARNYPVLIQYAPDEVLRASITVSLFLIAATMAWWISLLKNKKKVSFDSQIETNSRLIPLVFVGLGAGLLFHTAVISGFTGIFGSFYGVVRTFAVMLATTACYFMGVAMAHRILRKARLLAAAATIVAMVLLSWGSLFLVGGVLYLMAAMLGYVISSKRVPWGLMTGALVVLVVLHAGKADMRNKYWEPGTNAGGVTSVFQIHAFMAEWLEHGLESLVSGTERQDFVERASLLQLLLMAERLTPDFIGYLEGQSYSMVVEMLMPRFINPQKPTSQATMDMLNIRYGLVSANQPVRTAIGWGLIAEAYTNYGRMAVIAVAIVVGIFIGIITRYTVRATPISLPTLLGISVMTNMIVLEPVFANLFMNLWVAFFAVVGFYFLLRFLILRDKKRKRLRSSRMQSSWGYMG